MVRLIAGFCAFASTLSIVFASPTVADDALVKRDSEITHSGKVGIVCSFFQVYFCTEPQTQATWFHPDVGACGYTDGDSDPIVAISHLIYGSGGNCNQVCS